MTRDFSRRDFLKAGAGTTATVFLGSRGQVLGKTGAIDLANIQDNPPNLVLLLADDSGWTDYGFMGNTFVKTPNLDEVAQNGLIMNRFYAASAVCSPTRMSYMTGRNPSRGKVMSAGDHMPSEEITFAEILRNNGYTTGHFGKWHIGGVDADDPTAPLMQGFDHSFSIYNSYRVDKLRTNSYKKNGEKLPDIQEYVGVQFPTPDNFDGVLFNDSDDDDPAYDATYCTKVVMDEAIKWIESQANQEKRFCAVIQFLAPHDPFMSSPKYLKMYDKDDPFCSRDSKRPGEERAFWAMISGIDDQIGRLRNKLKELNVFDNTFTWYTSDNGGVGYSAACHRDDEAFPGPKMDGKKNNPEEGGFRVPCVMEWPGVIEPGTTSGYNAGTIDLLPTLCDLIGYDVSRLNRPLDGISILPALLQQKENREKNIIIHFDTRGTTKADQTTYIIRQDHYRLTLNYKREVLALYDLQSDPMEENDIAASHPDLVNSLKSEVEAWWDEVLISQNGEDYGPVALSESKKSGFFFPNTNNLLNNVNQKQLSFRFLSNRQDILWAQLSDLHGKSVQKISFKAGEQVMIEWNKKSKARTYVLTVETSKGHKLATQRIFRPF